MRVSKLGIGATMTPPNTNTSDGMQMAPYRYTLTSEPYNDDEILDYFYDDISNLEAEDREKVAFGDWLVEMLVNGVFYEEENEDAQ
jgi:hypothetical protein